MDKIQELNHFITEYGYLAIFLFVFLQELGVPNPITNELVLLFSGYLAYTGTLSITKVILTAVSADFIGTGVLYFIFYLLGNYYITKNPPRWLEKITAKLGKLKQRVDKGNQWGIFLGRLTPFLRGYISVAAGILQIKPFSFLTTALFSAVVWSGAFTVTGFILGPYWNNVAQKAGVVQMGGLILTVVIVLFLAGRYVTRKELAKNGKQF